MEHIYKSYYTKSDPIVNYMVSNLDAQSGMNILEPCAGDGVFIDALNGLKESLLIDIYELNPKAVETLKDKYNSYPNIKITHDDTITSTDLGFISEMGGKYDRIIANPPYGGWQDYDKRKDLKKYYGEIYVKETYALFLYRCIKLLKENGTLVFIIPDTYLNLHMFTSLREFILTNTKIKEIALFPSKFFPGVNFGYSDLSIITLEKCVNRDECLNNEFRVLTGFTSVKQLENTIHGSQQVHDFLQNDVFESLDHSLFVVDNSLIMNLINSPQQRIGEVADCVTGFYSGNDKDSLYCSENARSSSKYQRVDTNLISKDFQNRADILNGIEEPESFIPIVKGGGTKYYKQDLWFMDWSSTAVQHYKTFKKARFQNPTFYFKLGIGVPMISSRSISGALIENKLFDQSIVGVFPRDAKWIYYLLAFFNSPTSNILIRTINRSTNNSANYIKKIPFISPDESTLQKINGITLEIIESIKANRDYNKQKEVQLNEIIQQLYGF